MRSGYKNLAAMCLSAALMSPIAALAMPRPQDDHERHEQEEREHRVYDPAYKDYHNWDQREDGAYRVGWTNGTKLTSITIDSTTSGKKTTGDGVISTEITTTTTIAIGTRVQLKVRGSGGFNPAAFLFGL